MILILTIIAVVLTLWSVVRVLGSRESEDASVALVLIGLLHVAGFTLLFFAFPVVFIRSISEDQWVEWMTFWCALLAAGIGVRAFIRLVGQDRWVAVSVLALSLFCLFFALEEISWGQRILSFEGPEFITSRNSQSETNLHNLFMGPGKSEWNIKSVVFAGIVIFAIGVPAWLLDRGRGSWLARWPFPPAGAAPIFLASALCFKYLQHYRLDELGEYLLALGLLVTLAASVTRAQGLTLRRQAVLAGWGAILMVSLGTSAIELGSADGRMWSRNIFQYYLYSFAMDRYPKDGLWQNSRRVLEYAERKGFENQRTWLLLARATKAQGDEEGARTYLQKAMVQSDADVKAHPNDPFRLYSAALVHKELHQSAKANSLESAALLRVEEMIGADPGNGVLRTLQGYLYQELGNKARATATLKEMDEWDPAFAHGFRYMTFTATEEAAVHARRF
ncbi:tetratricopeptide repeat protein [Candidatus Nitrospira salsa]